MPRAFASLLLSLAALVPQGCVTKDVSEEPRIRRLGLIGRCLVLTADRPLIRLGRPYLRLAIQDPPQRQMGGPGTTVGTVAAGTRVRIVRVERATYYDDGLFRCTNDIAFGRIETGDHAGTVADLGWGWPAPTVLPRTDAELAPYAPCPP
jgi:hypothetical protein